MPLIRAAHIEQFGALTEGRDRIGELVRRLIWFWLPNRLVGHSFLSGEVNNFPGWDGWAQVKLNGAPDHYSLWEISTQRKDLAKIKADFRKSLRRDLPPSWSRSTATYVAVTTHKLKDRFKLRDELMKCKGNTWSDIQIIDGPALEQWIERCPPVQQWMAEEFGIGDGQFGETLTAAWKRWSEVTQPDITTDLVLAGRNTPDIASGLTFDIDPVLAVQADSPQEAVAVTYAVIGSLSPEEKTRLLSNALVLTSEERATAYAEQPARDDGRPLTILLPPATSQANRLVKQGHRVVLALGRKDSNSRGTLIKRALRSDFEKALTTSMGFTEAKATSDARACGSSVSIWRIWNLCETASPGSQVPMWAQPPQNQTVIPAILARAWDERVDGDKAILSALSGSDYDSYRDSIHNFAACDDALHETVGSVYKLVAPSVAYALVSSAIRGSQLTSFAEVAKTVFSAVEQNVADLWDIAEVETPLEDRSTYSSWLRDGLAETLLAIAYLRTPTTGVLESFGGGQAFADNLVRSLPGLSSDPRVVASLNEQLPYLAEAAPVPFVEALESLVQGDESLEPLFADRGMFGPRYHVGVLWALELLAWSSEYLGRVSMLLAQLNEKFAAISSGNKPLTSLKEIFLAWNPGTTATLSDRVSALEHMWALYPNTTWQLLLTLLPYGSDTASPTYEPSWRDFGRSDLKPTTRVEAARAYRAYTELALTAAESSIMRQLDLLKFYSQFPSEYQQRLNESLRGSARNGSEKPVFAWTTLRAFIAKNRSFSKMSWAVSGRPLEELEDTAGLFRPDKASIRDRWLFDDVWPEICRDAYDTDGRDEYLSELRREAIEDVLTHEGVAAINKMVAEANYPHLVGAAFATVCPLASGLLDAMTGWVRNLEKKGLHAVQAASGKRLSIDGDSWTSDLLARAASDNWPPEAVARSLLDYPTNMQTFKLVGSLGSKVSSTYWRHCWTHGGAIEDEAIPHLASKLIEAGRAAALIDLMSHRFARFGPRWVMRAIESTLSELNSDQQAGWNSTLGYNLSEALRWLRKQDNVDRVALARLEYPLVSLLTSPGSGDDDVLVLHEVLSSDPGFFVQVVCDVYREASVEKPAVVDDRARALASTGWRLLRSWKTVPGTKNDGSIDGAELTSWVHEVRKLAREKDREDVVEQHIGQVLFHAGGSSASGGAWLPGSVLEIIETSHSQHLEQGFEIECVNSRGVTRRSPLSGGELERAQEDVWQERTSSLGNKWPRVRAMFRRIADDWKRQARWNDQNAEKLRLRWS